MTDQPILVSPEIADELVTAASKDKWGIKNPPPWMRAWLTGNNYKLNSRSKPNTSAI